MNDTRALTADGKQRIKSDENTGQTWHLTQTRILNYIIP